MVVGHVVFDETLPLLVSSPRAGKRHWDLMMGLAAWGKGFVRPSKDLIRDQSLAVLADEDRPSAFDSGTRARSRVKRLPALVREKPERAVAEVAELRQRKLDFEAQMRLLRDEALIRKEAAVGRPPSLEALISRHAPQVICELLDRLGVGPIQPNEATRILVEPAPRMYAATYVAYVYFQVVQGWAPDKGDGYDLLHAVAATAAEEFVSRDERLLRLAEAGGDAISAVWDLNAFAETLAD